MTASLDQRALYDARLELADFLVTAFADVPDAALVEGLLAGEVTTPADEVNRPLDRGFERLRAFIAAAEGRDAAAVRDDLEREFTRLFVGPRPRIVAHETHYRDDTDFRGTGLAAVSAGYAAAGWAPPEDYPEEDDYLAVELAFLQHLVQRQRAGDETAFALQRAFHDEHLSTWVDAVAAAIREETDEAFYEAAGWLLEGYVAFEADLARQMG